MMGSVLFLSFCIYGDFLIGDRHECTWTRIFRPKSPFSFECLQINSDDHKSGLHTPVYIDYEFIEAFTSELSLYELL
jgi:hypothetical protein